LLSIVGKMSLQHWDLNL